MALTVQTLMLSVMVFNGIRTLQYSMTEQTLQEVSQITPVLNAALRAPLIQQDTVTVQAVLEESRATRGIDYAVVVQKSGLRLAASGWPADRSLPRPTDPSELAIWRLVPRFDVVAAIEFEGQSMGTLHFGLDLRHFVAAKRSLSLQSFAIAATEITLSLFFLTIMGIWITRHLTALMEASRQVTDGNLTPPRMREGEDDVGRLGEAFNAMSRAIADRVGALNAARENAEKNATNIAQLNRELEEQKAILDATLQSTPDLIFYKDLTGKYLGANHYFAEYVGRPVAAIVGHNDHDLFPQEVADFFRKRDLEMLATGEARTNKEWITRQDGNQRLVETKKSPLRDAAGKTIGLIGIARDITVRQLAEDQMRSSEANFRAYFETTQDMIVVCTPEGRVLYANPAIINRLCYSVEELDALGVLGLHPADRMREAEDIFGAMFRGERDSCTLPVQRKDGVLVPVDTRIFLGKWDGKECLFGVHRDLSAEQEAKQLFEGLFRRCPVLMSLSSMPARRFLDVNDTFLKTLGYIREEVIGRTSAELNLFPEPQQMAEAESLLEKEGRVSESEMVVRSRSGLLRNGLFSGEVFTSQDKSYLLTVMVDITERKQAESQLQAMNSKLSFLKEQADGANRARGLFLASMSHEIRTPLAGVLGMTALLGRTTLTDQQRHYMDKIQASGDALLALIGNILDFSKIDTGMMELDERPFLFHRDIADRLLSIMSGPAQEKGLEMRLMVDEGIPPLLGDAQRLTQVLLNLLSNAVKFTEKGMVTFSARIAAQEEGRVSLSLAVRDTGIGITQDQKKGLFQPFIQADASTARRHGGTGLGLAISRRIIELMEGEIVVESEPDEGSIFTVRLSLPLAAADEIDRVERSIFSDEKALRFQGVRALVAEDQPINQEIIAELLRLKGFEVDLAGNGREAVAKSSGANGYDLIFMDVQMPEMDGFEATKEIRAREAIEGRGRRPIIGLTAHAITEERQRGLAAGMDDYLTKPLDIQILRQVLLRWLPQEKRVAATPQGTGPADAAEVGQDMALLGLNVREGLQRVNGNQALYLKLLEDFVTNFGDMKTSLLKELRSDQLAEAIRQVHSVKGLSGNLGGKALMAAASSLEKTLREMDTHILFSVSEPLRGFIDRHQEFVAGAAAFIARQTEANPARSEAPEGALEEFPPLLEKLQAALAAEEARPCKEALAALGQRRWPQDVEKLIEEIRALVDRYRLDVARALLAGREADLLEAFGKGGGSNG
jgi:PAS domain S-box-containing protein